MALCLGQLASAARGAWAPSGGPFGSRSAQHLRLRARPPSLSQLRSPPCLVVATRPVLF